MTPSGMHLAIGITGTRHGATAYQLGWIEDVLAAHRQAGGVDFHHGDCVGVDAEAHEIAARLGYRVWIHPPTDPKLRAYCQGAYVVLPERPYHDRNRDIVRAVSFLIAVPDGPERQRSGTWSTVRYARRVGCTHGVVPTQPDRGHPMYTRGLRLVTSDGDPAGEP